jgi:diacylglycerol O-acyltransferase / wax synthase
MLRFAPPTLLEVGSHAAFQLPQPLIQTITTNVPGPSSRCTSSAGKMLEAHPAPIGGNVRIAIAIFSYLGRISFGLTADSSAAADLDILAQGIRHGLAELHTQSMTQFRPPGRARQCGTRVARAHH